MIKCMMLATSILAAGSSVLAGNEKLFGLEVPGSPDYAS
jgi:hypothetical protein